MIYKKGTLVGVFGNWIHLWEWLFVILLFKKGELALNDRYKAASDLISLIAVKSLSKSSIPMFICTLEVAIAVP